MKIPTTEYSIAIQEKVQINRSFLLSQGWELKEEKPLFETFAHPKNHLAFASIGMNGEFSVGEVHWCNQTVEQNFYALNPDLTTEDYFNIVKMLRVHYITN